jgi:hypothetical protein
VLQVLAGCGDQEGFVRRYGCQQRCVERSGSSAGPRGEGNERPMMFKAGS